MYKNQALALKFLTALREAGLEGITTKRGSELAHRYGAHLQTLYYMGYVIESKGKSTCTYKLVYEPTNKLTKDDCKVLLHEAMFEKYEIIPSQMEQIFEDLDLVIRFKDKHFFKRNVKHMQEEFESTNLGKVVNPELFVKYLLED